MEEVPFRLHQDSDGWPPFSVEWLWASNRGDNYVILQPPLFISGLASGDEISTTTYNEDGHVIEWSLVHPSSNSVIWISDIGENGLIGVLGAFRSIGCNTTMLRSIAHAAVDVPPSVTKGQVDKIIESIEGKRYAIAFPCDRQKE